MQRDAEQAVYEWLLSTGLAGGRVWLEMPQNTRTLPAILMQRVGGPETYAGGQPLMQFDCFGDTAAQANQLAYALASKLDAVTARTGGAVIGGSVESVRRINDKDAPYGRTVVDGVLYVRATNG